MASQSTASLSISDTDSLYIAVSSLHHELKSYAPEPRGNDTASPDSIHGKHCCMRCLSEWKELCREAHVCIVTDCIHCILCDILQ